MSAITASVAQAAAKGLFGIKDGKALHLIGRAAEADFASLVVEKITQEKVTVSFRVNGHVHRVTIDGPDAGSFFS